MRTGLRRGLVPASVALILAVALLPGPGRAESGRTEAAAAASGDPVGHLERFVEVAVAPEYRRFGSPGMAAAADHAAATLAAAGYQVIRMDVPLTRWAVDYSPGREPLLERIDDGVTFLADAVFSTTAVTPPDGITCTVRALDDVGSGDCGLVPFDQASPEWNNLTARAADAFDDIVAAGGVGAVVQADPANGARYALRIRRPIPGVVAAVDAADIIGEQVRLRVIGGDAPAIAHEVIGVRRPDDPTARSMVLQGHLDGWYEAAADNGAGAAAVLAAAERLAAESHGGGLVVALHDAEEWGLLGSRAMVEALASPTGVDVGDCGPPLHLGDIAGVVNLDASSARASDVQSPVSDILDQDVPFFQWRVLVFSEEVALSTDFVAAMAAHGVLGLPVTVAVANELNGGMGRTDGRWFHEAGVPVVWPVAGYPEYHTEADTLAAVDPADLEALTAATVDLLSRVDEAAIGPVLGATLPARGDGVVPAGCVAVPPAGATDGEAAARGTDGGGAGQLPATGRSAPWWPAAALLVAVAAGRRVSRAGWRGSR